MEKEHVIVYREDGKFAGWPDNYGMWVWGEEIVVSFTQCTFLANAGFHARTEELPAYPLQSRSLDGGRTWETIRTPAPSPGNRPPSPSPRVTYKSKSSKPREMVGWSFPCFNFGAKPQRLSSELNIDPYP